jgi:peptidoglycan L-alanyl-D-glutamate endopeptidase CwlK
MHFLLWAHSEGYEFTLGECQRTVEQQQLYYRAGRTKTMNSMHLKKCAQDISFFKDGKLLSSVRELKHLGDAWEKISSSNQWGGNWNSFKDTPHFQRTVK